MVKKQTKTKKASTKSTKVEAKKPAKLVAVKYDEKQTKKIKSFSKAGYITGIVSVATFITGLIGLFTGIISIVFSAISKNKHLDDEESAKKSKKGLQMGIAGTVLSAIMVFAWIVFISWFMWKFIIW